VIKTACQQACPAEAIVFGNIDDPERRCASEGQSRNYTAGISEHQAAIDLPARIRNPNPDMPDYYDKPLTTKVCRARASRRGGRAWRRR
jgi:molybdopterin-containing oxidoreductase family iron-sulfur binding subunit